MAETADDLSAPLGQKTGRRKRRFRLPFTGMQALAVVAWPVSGVFAGFAIFGDNPLGGEPIARVALRQRPRREQGRGSAAGADTPPSTAPKPARSSRPGEQKTVTIIDGSSGARHDVVIGDGAADKAEPTRRPR